MENLNVYRPKTFPKKEDQESSWDLLWKRINGLVNRVNHSNIKEIVVELFSENLIRGRGLFSKAIVRSQAFSRSFTPVFASLVAVINSKFPVIGELILGKLILQFRQSYRRNEKHRCMASATFMAHLVNQKVAHEVLVLELMTLFLDRPTNDSVELAIGVMDECGSTLTRMIPEGVDAIFERFREILLQETTNVRIQWMIQVLFQTRKDGFKSPIPIDLDLVEEDDKVTHAVHLDDEAMDDAQLTCFRYDAEFDKHEEDYNQIKQQILGTQSREPESEVVEPVAEEILPPLQDLTERDLVEFRKTVYLTIMSSLEFEECCHKLLKLGIGAEKMAELCNMIVECCIQEKVFGKFYGQVAERLCRLDHEWTRLFESCFTNIYATIHRYETHKIRTLGRLFSYLLNADAISWTVLGCIKLCEEETTSASRIFVKIVFEELNREFGVEALVKRFQDPLVAQHYHGLFPVENTKHLRFAINYFTAIELEGLTKNLRRRLDRIEAG